MHRKARYLLLPFLLLAIACPREDEVWVEDVPEAEEPTVEPMAPDEEMRTHSIEIENPTDQTLTIVAAIRGEEHELGRIEPEETERFEFEAVRGETVRIEARDAQGMVHAQQTLTLDREGYEHEWRIEHDNDR